MPKNAFAYAIAVAILNIAMNTLLNRIAQKVGSLWDAITTWQFALAFWLGCCSLLTLLNFYLQAVELARGVIVMAALSLILGTAVGTVVFGNKTDNIDIALLILILILLTLRGIRVSVSS